MKRVSTAMPRTVSAFVICVLVAASAVAGITHALAQASTIQFVNPSGYASPQVVSNQSDGGDTSYHLVAWVGSPHQNQAVEFEFQRTGERAQSIGFGTQRGSTYDLFWPVNVPDGSYTLRAILYENNVEVTRDETAVTVNNSGENAQNPTTDAETLEIVDPGIDVPSGAGTLGIFNNGTTSNFVMDVRFSAGTNFIQGFYTNSDPGTEPAWKTCGPPRSVRESNGAPAATADSESIKCTLQAGDTAASLEAVAAAANDSPSPLGFNASFNDSGDAHPVTTYNQVPTSVTVSPPPTATPGDCSGTLTARVRDQETQEIVGINVDVHASGPNDSLAFDTSRNNNPGADTGSDQNQPPNSSHVGFEPAEVCPPPGQTTPAPTTGGTQGRHNRVGTGNWDIKHIESVPGTDEDGNFDFRLFNAAAAQGGGPGTTLVTAWADVNEDDLLCANELRGTTSFNWTSASTVGAIENDPNCPTPPPPTSTLTVTKSGTGTGTVTSNPAGINCGNDCSETYANGTVVTLTANPDTPSTFTGWTGCDSTSGPSGTQCTVTMSASRTVNASFAAGNQRTLTVTKSGTGSGTVTSSPSGINCGNDCTENYANGTSVTLSATASTGSTFAGFTGCDTVAGNECQVTMNANRTVNAAFNSTTTASPTPSPTPTATPPGAHTVVLEPDSQTLTVEDSFTFIATVTDATGARVANHPVQWEESGEGHIVAFQERTDSQGQVRATVRSFNAGQQQLTIIVSPCATGGDCTDTSTITWNARADGGGGPDIIVDSDVNIRFRDPNIKGRVRTNKPAFPECREGRRIELRKTRPGKDPVKGRTRTNARGRYKFFRPNANGRFYVVARSKSFTTASGERVLCRHDRSHSRRIRR